jgi:hypothetical protein
MGTSQSALGGERIETIESLNNINIADTNPDSPEVQRKSFIEERKEEKNLDSRPSLNLNET